jgi:hypothetical protein
VCARARVKVVCIVCFTLEYLFRLMASPHRVSFCVAPLNLIDFVAIAPFYVEKIAAQISDSGDVSGLAVFRIIRIARVFRLFKLGRYSDGLKTFANTMARCASLALSPWVATHSLIQI